MAVLVYAESLTGSIKKAAIEAVTYGNLTAQSLGTECIALTIGTAEGAASLGQYGAAKVYNVAASDDFDAKCMHKSFRKRPLKLAQMLSYLRTPLLANHWQEELPYAPRPG